MIKVLVVTMMLGSGGGSGGGIEVAHSCAKVDNAFQYASTHQLLATLRS